VFRNRLKLTLHRHRKNRIITSAWDKRTEMAISLNWAQKKTYKWITRGYSHDLV
jgi:hypothetical protein